MANNPYVNKVQTADGTTIIDISDTTAVASDVASGKYFYTAAGAKTAGTGTGGGGEVEEKQVNFIDYDGTILYSYTKAEANALTELPSNPSHTGLTAQGWNWTLAQIQTQLTNLPNGTIWVGQSYTTASGKTEIVINLDSDRLKPYIFFAVNGTVVIDWGDGSSTSTVTGSSATTLKYTSHTYSAAGTYTILLNVTSGTMTFYNSTTDYRGLFSYTNGAADDGIYSFCVTNVRIGPNTNLGENGLQMCVGIQTVTIPTTCTLGNNCLYNLRTVKSITLPSGMSMLPTQCTNSQYVARNISIPYGITSIGNNGFRNRYNTRSYTIPYGVTSLGDYAFGSNLGMKRIALPGTLTTISQYCFQYCEGLTELTVPASVTSIGSNAFQYCRALNTYHFQSTTPPTITSTTFSNTSTTRKIYVPSSAVSTYKSASNWSGQKNYIYGE